MIQDYRIGRIGVMSVLGSRGCELDNGSIDEILEMF